jgi:hypothetical protein
MSKVSTDTDAGPQSSIGVGQTDPTSKALHEIQADWQNDGYGIRGPQEPRANLPVRPQTPVTFGIDNSPRARGGNEAPSSPSSSCDPGDPPSSGTWVIASVDGGPCFWYPTTTCDES